MGILEYNYLIICIILYISMQFVESISFSAKIAGKLTDNLSSGVTIQHTIYQTSRIFLPFLLLFLSFLIETGLSLINFLLLAFLSTFFAFTLSFISLRLVNNFQILFQKIFLNIKFRSLPIAIIQALFSKRTYETLLNFEFNISSKYINFKKVVASCFAYTFLSTGFFLSFTLAILNPEYRMTASQLTTVFHGFGALFLAFYIDPMLSKSLDNKVNSEHWVLNFYSIYLGRMLAYLLSSIGFLIFYLLNL